MPERFQNIQSGPTFGQRFREFYWKPGASGWSNAGRVLRAVIMGPASVGGAIGGAAVDEGAGLARNALARVTFNRDEARGDLGPIPEGMVPRDVRNAPRAEVAAGPSGPNLQADPRNVGAGPPTFSQQYSDELARQLIRDTARNRGGAGARGGQTLAEGEAAQNMVAGWQQASRDAALREAERRYQQRASMIEK